MVFVLSTGMWVGIVATISHFRPVIGDITLPLLGPYLLWVTYATALTIWIWRHNPPQVCWGGLALGCIMGCTKQQHADASMCGPSTAANVLLSL